MKNKALPGAYLYVLPWEEEKQKLDSEKRSPKNTYYIIVIRNLYTFADAAY